MSSAARLPSGELPLYFRDPARRHPRTRTERWLVELVDQSVRAQLRTDGHPPPGSKGGARVAKTTRRRTCRVEVHVRPEPARGLLSIPAAAHGVRAAFLQGASVCTGAAMVLGTDAAAAA